MTALYAVAVAAAVVLVIGGLTWGAGWLIARSLNANDGDED